MRVLVTHPGTQYSHRLVVQLNRLDYLYKFITGIAFTSDSAFLKIIPRSIQKKISNRILDTSIARQQVVQYPVSELKSLYQLWRGMPMENVIHIRNEEFQNQISDMDLLNAACVIGFDTSSWILAQRTQKMNKPFFLDQSIGHPREKEKVYEDLRTRYVDWCDDLSPKTESEIKVEELEYSLSTKIVVASSFTKNSLLKNGVASQKIIVNPYGVSKNFFEMNHNHETKRGKIRFLYLGLLGARKGLPLLLEVWKENEMHDFAELWLAGPAATPLINTLQNIEGIAHQGKVPFKDIPALLNSCDCLVFPSFFEGFGQVILEAMAAGLPVITTDATAGPDIIESGKDGIVIQAGDKKDLAAAMKLLAGDRSLCRHMGKLAVEKAKSFSWDAYGDRWKRIIDQ